MQTQVWFPDTCACGMAILIDGEQVTPLENGFSQMAGREVPIYCPAHTGLDFRSQYDAVLEENQRKNFLIRGIVTNIPETAENILDDRGNIVEITMKNTVSLLYHFDETRVLVVEEINGVSSQVKQDVKSFVLGLNDSRITHI